MDKIAIFGVPRSGTSWLSQIVNSHPDVALRFQPLFSYGHKGNLSEHSSPREIQKFFDEILCSQDAFALMATEMQKNYPTFQKSAIPSHIAFKETRYLNVIENLLNQCSDVKIIGIVRNPLAVMSSWMSTPKEFNPSWNILNEWRTAPSKNQGKPEEYYGFDRWRQSAEMFLQFRNRFPNQFFLLDYDELNRFPFDKSAMLFDFCGLEMCRQVQEFLIASKSRHDPDPYSVFRSQANDDAWRKILPLGIAKQIMFELKNTPLNIFLQDRTNA